MIGEGVPCNFHVANFYWELKSPRFWILILEVRLLLTIFVFWPWNTRIAFRRQNAIKCHLQKCNLAINFRNASHPGCRHAINEMEFFWNHSPLRWQNHCIPGLRYFTNASMAEGRIPDSKQIIFYTVCKGGAKAVYTLYCTIVYYRNPPPFFRNCTARFVWHCSAMLGDCVVCQFQLRALHFQLLHQRPWSHSLHFP